MNIYSFALFLHIAGALGFFITLGLEWTSLNRIRKTTVLEQVRAWMSITNGTRRLGMASMLTIVVSGLYLMVSTWGGAAWIIVTLGAMALMIVLINTLTRPRTLAIGREMIIEKGSISPALQSLANDPLLWISIQVRLAIALGIIFLMTVKPGLSGSLLTIGTAIALGLAVSLPAIRRKVAQEERA